MLRQAIEMGREIRPISVALLADGRYRIVGDGRHRCEAHIRAGCTHIEAIVINTRTAQRGEELCQAILNGAQSKEKRAK